MGTQKKKRCVIISAGPIKDCAALKPLIDKENDYIICVDGGANHLKALAAVPDIIIGDLDSAGELPEGIEIVKFKAEKDETDTMLAVMYGLIQGYKDFLIIGGLSGRLDHTYANLCTLGYIARHGARGHIADSENEAYFVQNGTASFKKRNGYYISVFPFDGTARGVYETGFKYGLNDAELTTEIPIGVSNEFKDEIGTICVKNGSLLIILSKK